MTYAKYITRRGLNIEKLDYTRDNVGEAGRKSGVTRSRPLRHRKGESRGGIGGCIGEKPPGDTARGGAWDSLVPITISERTPLPPGTARADLGFRCVVEE